MGKIELAKETEKHFKNFLIEQVAGLNKELSFYGGWIDKENISDNEILIREKLRKRILYLLDIIRMQ